MKTTFNKINVIKSRIEKQYLKNARPFVVGFSGGKDSSLLLQLFIDVLINLQNKGLIFKKSYIISSNTMVENPIVSNLIEQAFKGLKKYKDLLNLEFVHVKPQIDKTFWVSTLGKGYPLPLNRFRWCTRQLKIDPMQITENQVISELGDIISVLGIRTGESQSRKDKMKHTELGEFLYENTQNEQSQIFAPLADLDIETLWKYLLYINESYWGSDFGLLYESYFDSKNECPMVVEVQEKEELIEKCGNSRWGCWMCPLSNDIWIDGMVSNGYDEFSGLAEFRKKMMIERDQTQNRYHGKHINWNNGKITLGLRGLIKLKTLDEKNYFLESKGGRNRLELKRNKKSFTTESGERYLLKTYKEFFDFFKNTKKSFFKESSHMKIIVVKEDCFFLPSVGPYTISYRLDKLEELVELRKTYESTDMAYWGIKNVDIITDEEVIEILNLNEKLSRKLNKREIIKRIRIIRKNFEGMLTSGVNFD